MFRRYSPLFRCGLQTAHRCAPRLCVRYAQKLSNPTPANRDDTKQNDPQDPQIRDTGSPFDTTKYNPKVVDKQLPAGWRDERRDASTDDALNRISNLSDADEELEELMIAHEGWNYQEKMKQRHARAANGQQTQEELEEEQNAEDEELEDMEDPGGAQGFFAMDEERNDPSDDPEFDHDDITSLAHGELEQHREVREFYRTIAWDMPLLYNHRKEFKPPTAAQPLRFRYTTYMGDTHPAARKVVCDFTPSALPDLTKQQSDKLIKILGVRYNPLKDSAKLSCEMFPTPAQNKRYLGDLVNKLIDESKNGKDTFEDVPFDFRHAKAKKNIEFPEEWKMTDERKRMLEARRVELDQRRLEAQQQGVLVEGATLVQEASLLQQQKEPVPVRAPAARGRPAPTSRPRTTLR